ncbi:MAG: hypothetical protein ABSH32_24815 [Bryobacteraceae bacterium]
MHLVTISAVEIDLAQLREMHTRLPTDLALVMVGRAALALERNTTHQACASPWIGNGS